MISTATSRARGKMSVTAIITIIAVLIITTLFGYRFWNNLTARKYLARGQELIKQKNYEEAGKVLYQYNKMAPGDKEGYILLSRALIMTKKADLAYSVLTEAKERFPVDGKMEIEMARVYMAQGQNEKAKADLNSAWEKDKSDPTPKMLMGLIYVDDQNPDKALEQFVEIMNMKERKGENSESALKTAYSFIPEIIGNTGRNTAENIKLLETIAQSAPDMEKARANVALGVLNFKTAQYDKALEYFQKALQISPDTEQWANLAIAVTLVKMGKNESAIKHYKDYLAFFDNEKNITQANLVQSSIYKGMELNELNIPDVKSKLNALEAEN